ncbi:MAG: PQQ-dependent sugar dehydrogenase, partial [Gammaproteobacteria bacterium]
SPINHLSVPDGFSISIFADNIISPRQMAEGNKGYIFVGSRKGKEIIVLKDSDGNGISDFKRVIASSLSQPSGVSFYNGDLYFSEIDKIWKIEDIETWIENRNSGLPEKILVSDSLPSDEWHGWKWLAHNSLGELFTNIGAPCNVCIREDQRYATIVKFVDEKWVPVARGVRNSVGFDFHPDSEELYFGDNGRDWLGDDEPSCELNRLIKDGSHFGFPYLHASNIIDPEFGEIVHGYDINLPIAELGAHVAPTGLTFYDHYSFGPEYKNNIFIALHGSWNRSSKVGYKLLRVSLDNSGNVLATEDFVTGFLANQSVLGRPSAPMVLKDGSLLLSDDKSNTIYRVTRIN